jgi:hemolysin activation/secretion protein
VTRRSPSRISVCSILMALITLGLPCTLQAQVSLSIEQLQQLRQIEQQLRNRAPEPPQRAPSLDLRILTPEKAAVPRAVDELEFEVKQVEIAGATFFPKAEVDAFFAPLLQKKIGLTEIRLAADALERKYRERGFFLARVFIPPQQLKEGMFRVQVIEGHISQVYVEGTDAARSSLVEAFAQQITSLRPLDLGSLERLLLLINDLPGVSATAVLRPGAELGSSELLLSVMPLGDLHMLSFNNTGSRTTGPYSLSHNATFQQAFGSPGQLNLSLTGSGADDYALKGIRSAVARYTQALGNSGLIFSFGGSLSKSRPAGSLERINLVSDATSLSPKLRYPLLRSRASSVYLDGGMSVNRSETTTFGTIITSDRYTAADVAASWSLDGWLGGSQNLGLGITKGLNLFGAMDGNAPNPSSAHFETGFTKVTVNLQRTQELPQQFSLRFNANGQHTRGKLLSGELISFGGPSLGRAYAAGAIAGDKGLGALLELRYDFKQRFVPAIGNLQAYISADSATTRTVAVPSAAATRAHLSSDAIGLRFSLLKDAQIDLRIARSGGRVTDDSRRDGRLLLDVLLRF